MKCCRVAMLLALVVLAAPEIAIRLRAGSQPAMRVANTARPEPVSAARANMILPTTIADGQGCSLVAVPPSDLRTNMFSNGQEQDLGDAVAEQVQREYLVIDDDDITGYLQRIGGRLLAQALPGDFVIHFYLFDLPVANALTLPGGRIYVSRKLVAQARNEDELAGVLAHELGHALTHQTAMQMTKRFREVLGLNAAGSREEIFRDYQTLADKTITKRKAFQKTAAKEEDEQLVADQLGLQLLVRAGYAARAFPDFFDRVTDTKGKTGGWLSDLFGTTRPNARRLREMLKQVASLPAECIAKSNSPPDANATQADFQKWQTVVVNYQGLGHKEQLHELFGKTKLNPPLRADLRFIRISPNGKYFLAQDEASIFVFTREPEAWKFTIYAPEAFEANFTPDSDSIVFHTESLRVETWSVEDEVRTDITEMAIGKECRESALSPDATYLACFTDDFELVIYEVATGELRFEKKNFSELTWLRYYSILLQTLADPEGFELVHMRFSPDGRYFVAHGEQDATVAIELDTFKTFSLPAAVRELMWGNFTFVGPDKIAGNNQIIPKNSGVVKFPSGEGVAKMQFGASHLQASVDGRYVIVRPIKEHAVGVVDLTTASFVIASDKHAFDIYGDTYLNERLDGDIAVHGRKDGKEISQVKLPEGQLGFLRAASISPDLHWLAISERSRGGLWNLAKGERVFYTRGFNGATVSGSGVVDADFAKYKEVKREMGRMDPATRRIDEGKDISDQEIWQFGPLLLRTVRKGKNEWKLRDVTTQAEDATTGKSLWSRDYPKEAPRYLSSRPEGNLVLAWPATSDGAKLELKNNAALGALGGKLQGENGDYFLEVVEPATGKILGALVVRTGKRAFRLLSAESSGDWLVAEDSENRLLVYSLASGEQTGILFGRRPVISGATSLVAAQNERGQLLVYDLKTMTRRQEYFFTSRIAFTYFAPDNRRIFVLTGDQTAYFLAVPKAVETAAH